VPTLYDWAGGDDAFARLIDAFYDRVEADELQRLRFATLMSRERAVRR
jgi:hemoglobin